MDQLSRFGARMCLQRWAIVTNFCLNLENSSTNFRLLSAVLQAVLFHYKIHLLEVLEEPFFQNCLLSHNELSRPRFEALIERLR